MSTWTDEQEREYQDVTRRSRELETKRNAVLRDREKGVETVAQAVFKEAGFTKGDEYDPEGDPGILARALTKNAAAVRAALAPYDGSNVA